MKMKTKDVEFVCLLSCNMCPRLLTGVSDFSYSLQIVMMRSAHQYVIREDWNLSAHM